MREEFAKNLTMLRQNAGVSQRTAAAALQVSQALLSHYEKGIREPGLDFVVRAAQYYGVSTDVLLGRQPIQRRTRFLRGDDETQPPNLFVQEVEQELWDTMGILLDALERNYDPNVFCYASIYLAEVLYELLRYYIRLTENYDPEYFHLSEHSFLSGAVSCDLAWVRTQYVMAVRQFKERVGELPSLSKEEMTSRYGDALPAMLRLLRLVGRRVSRQDAAESQISSELLAPPSTHGWD